METRPSIISRILDLGEIYIEKIFQISFSTEWGIFGIVILGIMYAPILIFVGFFGCIVFIFKVRKQLKMKNKDDTVLEPRMSVLQMIIGGIAAFIIFCLSALFLVAYLCTAIDCGLK